MHPLFIRNENLGRSCPHHHHTLAIILLLKVPDVAAQLFHHLPSCQALLHVISVKAFGKVFIEGGLHRHDVFQFVAHGFDIFLLQHLSIYRCLISVLRIDIPCAENDIVELGQRNDVSIAQIFLVCAPTHSYFVILSHRAYGLSQSFSGHQDTCYKSGRHGTTAHNHDAQLTVCWFYLRFCHFLVVL